MAGTFEVSVFPDEGTGLLFRNRGIRIREITDGMSHTIMVSERASRQSPQTTWVGAVTNASVPPINPGYDNEGPPVLVLTNTGTVDDARVPNNELNHVEDSNSAHPQGVHLMFCDGSVQSINNDVDPSVWVAIGTRAGEEPNGSVLIKSASPITAKTAIDAVLGSGTARSAANCRRCPSIGRSDPSNM